jgi:hypothetical protein
VFESEQQAEAALSLSQEQVLLTDNCSIFTSAMIVDLSIHIDEFRYEEINSHIEICQYEIAPTGPLSPRAQTSHSG